MKRILAIILALCTMVTTLVVPAFAAENNDDEYILLEVIESEAVLRNKAEQRGSILATAHKGDVLYCTESVKNRHGNIWYKCVFVSEKTGSKQTGWIFADRVTKHHHKMESVSEDNELNLSYCKCGHFESNSQGMQRMGNSLALPMDRPLISPEEIAVALGFLKATGVKIGGAVISAVPYVLIPLAVGGVAYMAYVNCNTTTAEVVDVKKMTKDYRPSDYEDGKYYYSAIYKRPSETDGVYSTVLILPVNAMDLNEATTYMKAVIAGKGLLQAAVDNFTVTIDSVYTPDERDAKRLCKELKSYGFYYGSDSCADEHSDYNKTHLTANWLYFEHYHVYFDPLAAASGMDSHATASLKKVSGHIFFGIPFSFNGYPLETF